MIQLNPMLEPDFSRYLSWVIADFAKDKVDAGNWHPDEALEKSEVSYKKLLPDGLKTKDNYLYSIFNETQNVGMIWFFADYSSVKPKAFIYDFVIDEAFRRQGNARAALFALEEKVKALGISTLALHVFAHNTAARKLYEQVGFELTNLSMAKELK